MIVNRITGIVDGTPPDEWPFSLAPVQTLLSHGLTFTAPVTFLVGENGSGKSTIVEAIAEAYGADVRGGHIGRRYSTEGETGPLGPLLRLHFPTGTSMHRKPKGFFLRAETAYGVFEFMSGAGVPGYGEKHLLQVSHGESFLQVFNERFNEPGLYLLDEPEAALSFQSCLALLNVLHHLGETGAQVICATHSPILASLPGATVIELGERGLEEVAWADLNLVAHWRHYLENPGRYLRHLL